MAAALTDNVVRFERFELDLERERLRDAGGAELQLPRLSQRLLCYLAANRDRVVPFGEMQDEVWGGVHVGKAAIHQALRQLRSTLGDDGQRQAIIRTVRGVGYRFVAPARSGVAEREAGEDGPLYVGRPALLAELQRHLEASLAGRGRLVLLCGEPGVGKSRTAAEIVGAARGRGALAIRGGSGSPGGAPPYWPWPSLFAALSLRRPVAELRREIEELAPRFLDLQRAAEAPPSLDDVARFRLFDAAARCLVRASRLGPLVLWLDDLHEMGAATLELLHYVAHAIADSPVLILAALRREQAVARAELAAPLSRLEVLPGAARLEIAPLDEAETASLVLGLDPPVRSDAFVALLCHATEGNPFYITELTRYLTASVGSAKPQSIDWRGRIPEGIQHVLAARLAALAPGTRRTLAAAACLGVEFDAGLLERALPHEDVAARLGNARSLGMVIGSRAATRFAHPLIREAIVAQELRDPDAKRRLHLAIAEAYVESAPERVAEAAFHFAAAAPLGGVERAVAHLVRAARQAEELFDDEQAWTLYDQALRLLERGRARDDALRCELLIAAGEVAVRGARADEARGLLREGATVARRCGLSELLGRAALGLAYRDEILGLAEPDVAALLDEALEENADAQGTSPLRVRLLSALALKIRYEPGALGRAVSLIEESVGLAKASGDASALARALEDASFVHWSVEDPEGWIQLNHDVVEAASEARDLALVFRGVKGLATGLLEIGDRVAAEREIERCDVMARRAPAPYLQAIRSLQRGSLAFLDGRLDEGEAHALAAAQSGLPAVTPLAAVQLYYHRLETARMGELEASIRSLVASSPGIAAWRFALARLLAELGRSEEADEQLARAGPLAQHPRDRHWLAAGALGAEAAARTRNRRVCAELFETLEPHARVNVVAGHGALCFGNTAHFLGVMAGALGRRAAAERHLASALAMHERLRATPWVLRTRIALARLAAPRASSAERAATAQDLREQARSLGLAALVRDSEALEPAR